MDRLVKLINEVDVLKYSGNQKCIELMDNRLQDIMILLYELNHKASGELIDLKACSWVLHERWYMDTEEQLKWTFHHTKHRILKSGNIILDKLNRKEKLGMYEVVNI